MSGGWKRTHDGHIEATGEVLEADVRRKRFELWINGKTKLSVPFSEDQEADVTTALKEHETLRLWVKGPADFSPKGELERLKSVDRMKLCPVGETPFDDSARPIGEVLEELAREVPQEEWDRLPEDLIDNLDHYIYDTPKR